MKKVKGDSSKWINQSGLLRHKFSWQEGYGGFSYSRSHLPKVIRYIQNQKKHHKKQSFMDEYQSILKAFEVDFDNQYIFNPVQ